MITDAHIVIIIQGLGLLETVEEYSKTIQFLMQMSCSIHPMVSDVSVL